MFSRDTTNAMLHAHETASALLAGWIVACSLALSLSADAKAEDWIPAWSTATLSQARTELAVISAGNNVIFAGGLSAPSTPSAVVDIYNTTTGSWSNASLSQARGALAATVTDTKVYLGGGRRYGPPNSDVVDVYDAATGTWSMAHPLSVIRQRLAAASAGDKVLFAGGESYGGGIFTDAVDIYDVPSGAWSPSRLSQARVWLAGTSVGNKIFFAGGNAPGQIPSSVVDVYDTVANTWSTATLSQSRNGLAAISVGNKAFFGGGASLPGGVWTYSNVLDIYDAASGTWSATTIPHVAAYVATSLGGKVCFAGTTDALDIYDPATGAWSSATRPHTRAEGIASSGNRVFITNGTDVDIYTLQDYGSITSAKPFTLGSDTNVAGRMQLSAPGSLNLGSYRLNAGSLAGDAPIDLASGTLTAGSDNTSTTYTGVMSGNGGLIKTGTGTLTLAGTHSYTGPTAINAGVLKVSGSLSTISSVTINNAGVLTGTGTVGDVLVRSGGRVAPGDAGVGRLTISSLTLNSGSVLDYCFSPSFTTNIIHVAKPNGLSLNGTSVNLFNADGTTPLSYRGTYALLNYTGSISGTGVTAMSVLNPQPGKAYAFNTSNGDVNVTVDLVIPPRQPAPTPPHTFNPTERLAEWNGTDWVSVPAGSISGDVHVLVHGWAPGERGWVESVGYSNAKVWDAPIVENPNQKWFQGFSDLANSIKAKTGDRVLAFTWIDMSATDKGPLPMYDIANWRLFASESQNNTPLAGQMLGSELKAAIGSNSAALQFIGHSHGAKVAATATLKLLSQGVSVKHLTVFDSPDNGVVPASARNNLSVLLDQLASVSSNLLVDNYYSLFGRRYGGLAVDVQLDNLDHGYPYAWYNRSATAPVPAPNPDHRGLDWSPLAGGYGASLPTKDWQQDWRDGNGNPIPERELNLIPWTYRPPPPPVTAIALRLVTLATDANVTPLSNSRMQLTEHSPAYWDTAFDKGANDETIQFTYQFTQPGDGDQLGIWIDGQLRFIMPGETAGTDLQFGYFDIADLMPGTHIMTIALHDYGSSQAQFDIGDFKVISVPEPSALGLLAVGIVGILFSRRRGHRIRAS